MAIDTDSVVRVKLFVKRVTARSPVTGLTETWYVPLGWGVGEVDWARDGYYTFGAPNQAFTTTGEAGIIADPILDSRVHFQIEELPTSQLQGDARVINTDTLMYKNPNI